MPKFDVTLAGEANLDMLLYGLPVELPVERELLASDLSISLGGSSAITAHNLAKLGSRVGFISQAGDDAFASFCLHELQLAGVDISCVVPSSSGLGAGITIFLQHLKVRHAFTYSGTIGALKFSDLDLDYLTSSRHFHLSALFLQESLSPDAPKLLAAMRQAGLSTALDTNDDPSGQWKGTVLEALEYVDIFLPNETEACRIAREDDVERAARKSANNNPPVVLKPGDRGAMSIHERKRYEIPVCKVSSVDAVGAGDSFNAGFLHAWTHEADIEQCLQLGSQCGAFSTSAQGGTSAFKNAKNLVEYLSRDAMPLSRSEI